MPRILESRQNVDIWKVLEASLQSMDGSPSLGPTLNVVVDMKKNDIV